MSDSSNWTWPSRSCKPWEFWTHSKVYLSQSAFWSSWSKLIARFSTDTGATLRGRLAWRVRYGRSDLDIPLGLVTWKTKNQNQNSTTYFLCRWCTDNLWNSCQVWDRWQHWILQDHSRRMAFLRKFRPHSSSVWFLGSADQIGHLRPSTDWSSSSICTTSEHTE